MCVCDNCWRFKLHIPKRSIEHNLLQTNTSMWSSPTICRSFPDRFPPWVFQHIFAALPQVSNVNCQDFPWLCHVLCTANADDRWTGVVRTSFYDAHPTPSCQCCYNEASRVPRPEVSLGAGIGWKIRTVEQCHIFYFGILPWLPMFKTKSILWNWLLKISMDRVVSSAGEENFLEGKNTRPGQWISKIAGTTHTS